MYLCWKQSSFISECQISTLSLPLLVRTSVIPASVCPAYQSDHHVSCRVGGGMPFDVCSVSPPLHTSHLQSAWRNTVWNTGLILFPRSVNASRDVCLHHSRSQITADYYHTRYRRRHANRYIVFADTPVQWMNTHRYTISV